VGGAGSRRHPAVRWVQVKPPEWVQMEPPKPVRTASVGVDVHGSTCEPTLHLRPARLGRFGLEVAERLTRVVPHQVGGRSWVNLAVLQSGTTQSVVSRLALP